MNVCVVAADELSATFRDLVKLWLLGDRFADTKLRNVVVGHITSTIARLFIEDMTEVFTPEIITSIWSATTTGRALRRLVLDSYASYVRPDQLAEQIEELSPEFVKDLTKSDDLTAPFPPTITDIIWSATTSERALRRVVIDYFTSMAGPEMVEPDFDDYHPEFMKEFLLASLHIHRRMEGKITHPCLHDRCNYHDHDEQYSQCREGPARKLPAKKI